MSDNWPKYPDGRPMKMGEMTREQQREQFKLAGERLKKHLENPQVKKKFKLSWIMSSAQMRYFFRG